MKFGTPFIAAALTGLAATHPTEIVKRASSCGQYDSVVTGTYTVYNNLWGESSATSGSQCFSVSSLSSGVLSWATTWSWSGGAGSVKSFANAVVNLSTKEKLSAISAMKSTWKWSYSGSSIVADVAYDMFTSSSASGSNEYEIMIWLAALGGAGPISSTYGSDGSATPITTTTIAGTSFKLYKGPNGSMTVFSFVASSEVQSFSGDLKDFFTYLINNEGLSSSQYLLSAGAGTEAFTGSSATFTTSAYSLVVS